MFLRWTFSLRCSEYDIKKCINVDKTEMAVPKHRYGVQLTVSLNFASKVGGKVCILDLLGSTI